MKRRIAELTSQLAVTDDRAAQKEQESQRRFQELQSQLNSLLQSGAIIPPCPSDAHRGQAGMGTEDDYTTEEEEEFEDEEIGHVAGIAVGMTITLNVFVAGPISGASMNPARSIGPAIVKHVYKGLWVYVVGPIIGTIAGAFIYNLIRSTDKPLSKLAKSLSSIRS